MLEHKWYRYVVGFGGKLSITGSLYYKLPITLDPNLIRIRVRRRLDMLAIQRPTRKPT